MLVNKDVHFVITSGKNKLNTVERALNGGDFTPSLFQSNVKAQLKLRPGKLKKKIFRSVQPNFIRNNNNERLRLKSYFRYGLEWTKVIYVLRSKALPLFQEDLKHGKNICFAEIH